MVRFGDMQWAAATGGSVNGLDRLRQIGSAVRAQLTLRLRSRPKAAGLATAAEVDRLLEEVRLPETPLVGRAVELVTTLGPASLTRHVLRTWAWGVVLGLRDGLSFDRETFALAALLHDVALSRRTTGVTCFAADGASQAMALLSQWGAPDAMRAKVGDAVCLHLRTEVPRAYGIEAHLVNAGAAVDVVGARLREVPIDVRKAILERYPRGDLKAFLVDVFERERAAHPTSRIALWVSLGFLDRVERAPFDG